MLAIMTPLYTQTFVTNPDEVFKSLLELNWLEATEARREYFMSDVPRSYTYGKGIGVREYHSEPFITAVAEIMAILNKENSYNICFLNRYDTKKSGLGWHSDNSSSMDGTHPIAVVSFGAEREIWWKLQTEKGVIPESNKQKLHNGSLFVMPAGFQDLYFHRIPRSDKDVGTRISLTFRKYI
jgi:alkylated DNA repair dioxygenase AlkB